MSQNSRNQGCSFYYICLIIEGSGSGSRAESGSKPLTNGSGSGRPENMWIRIRFRIRIRNTGWRVGNQTNWTVMTSHAYNRIASYRHVPPWAYIWRGKIFVMNLSNNFISVWCCMLLGWKPYKVLSKHKILIRNVFDSLRKTKGCRWVM